MFQTKSADKDPREGWPFCNPGLHRARKVRRVIECCFRVRCHSYQSRLQVAIATRRTRRVEGGTHPRGGSDGTPDDHGNKQNRQAGNAWMLTARTRAARRLPQPRKRFDGLVWGLKDEFTLANLDVKFLSADVRFQVQNRVSTRKRECTTRIQTVQKPR